MNRVRENLNGAGKDLKGTDFSDLTYSKCVFNQSDLRTSKFENAFFSSCDFRGVDFRNATFRLTCEQGARNKLDDKNLKAFLFWLVSFFELSINMDTKVKAIIGSDLEQLKRYFEREVGG